MAVEHGKYLAKKLAQLPANHPDRAHLEGLLALNDAYTQKGPQEEYLIQGDQFSPETRKALEAEGAVIYRLTMQSLSDLREAGKPFWSRWHIGHEFESIPSRLSEVAIKPFQFFLEGSNRKPMNEQLTMLENYDKELARKIPGAQVVLGSVSDYAELSFCHLDANGLCLFGAENDLDYARTVTPKSSPFGVVVGYASPPLGLSISTSHRKEGHNDLWVAPLIVPARR